MTGETVSVFRVVKHTGTVLERRELRIIAFEHRSSPRTSGRNATVLLKWPGVYQPLRVDLRTNATKPRSGWVLKIGSDDVQRVRDAAEADLRRARSATLRTATPATPPKPCPTARAGRKGKAR